MRVRPMDVGARSQQLAEAVVDRFGLDLRGMTVLTEAASGPYLHTPLLGALAGADRVIAVTADSVFASASEVESATRAAAEELGVAEGITIKRTIAREDVAQSDIVTNSGFVRPIDARFISYMKPTGVIPLMWETWEMRSAEIDLEACRRRGILVLGTDESKEPLNFYPYVGMVALKALFALGLECYRTRVLLLGSGPAFGVAVESALTRAGAYVDWFGEDERARPYGELEAYWREAGEGVDVVILAEHRVRRPLIGPGGHLAYRDLASRRPDLRVAVIGGHDDGEGLLASGLHVHPQRVRPWGYMSLQPGDLGPRPVLELYAAGLRVGQEMARVRLAGGSVDAARAAALRDSPAMDFT